MFSSDTIGFVKDTTKEDAEEALKNAWEVEEPGRSNRAKKARMLFLAQDKQKKGKMLNDEELLILKQPFRERKLSMPVIMDELPKIANKLNKADIKDNKKGKTLTSIVDKPSTATAII